MPVCPGPHGHPAPSQWHTLPSLTISRLCVQWDEAVTAWGAEPLLTSGGISSLTPSICESTITARRGLVTFLHAVAFSVLWLSVVFREVSEIMTQVSTRVLRSPGVGRWQGYAHGRSDQDVEAPTHVFILCLESKVTQQVPGQRKCVTQVSTAEGPRSLPSGLLGPFTKPLKALFLRLISFTSFSFQSFWNQSLKHLSVA